MSDDPPDNLPPVVPPVTAHFDGEWFKTIGNLGPKLAKSVAEEIRQEEARHRNAIGLAIVKTLCNAFMCLLIGDFIIFGWMAYHDQADHVELIISFTKEFASILKDGFLPVVLVALGYFFGSNNTANGGSSD